MKVEQILKLLPESELNFLSGETKVDHQVKKLKGVIIFKLILFSMLNTTIALPNAILKNKYLSESIVVFDHGLQTRKVFNEFTLKSILFVGSGY